MFLHLTARPPLSPEERALQVRCQRDTLRQAPSADSSTPHNQHLQAAPKTWQRMQAFLSKSVTGFMSIAGKVGIDQLCYSPLCTMVFLTWCNAACMTPEKIPRDISQKLVSCTTASWSLWGPMMAINMAVVPAQLRMLFINVISLFWTYKLSTMSSAAPACDPEVLELAQPEMAPASAACVAEILADMPEDFSDFSVRCSRNNLPTT